ncbi:MAG: hypothetical protein NWS07_01305, partial [Desulfobacterales bacterium]|nr:hypothetical protein [Desulfobacterales bacterium]
WWSPYAGRNPGFPWPQRWRFGVALSFCELFLSFPDVMNGFDFNIQYRQDLQDYQDILVLRSNILSIQLILSKKKFHCH